MSARSAGASGPSADVMLASGERHRFEGSAAEVEECVLAASRGSIMALAWLTERPGGRRIGVNPAYVVTVADAPPAGP